MRAKAAEDWKKVLEAVQLVAQYGGSGVATLLDDPLLMTLVGAIVGWWVGGTRARGGHDSFISGGLSRTTASGAGTSRRYFGKSTTALKVVLRLLLYPVFWLGRMPQHFVFMRHRLIDLKLWLVYGCIVAYYSFYLSWAKL